MRRIVQLLIISLLVFGLAGISTVAASDTLNPGYPADPDFFSPNWKPAKITSSYSDPYFFNSNWKPARVNYSYSDPDFFLPSWKVPSIKPVADPDFLYSNWSVHAPVLFRYSGMDPKLVKNYNLDPFASDDELRAQGFEVSNNLW